MFIKRSFSRVFATLNETGISFNFNINSFDVVDVKRIIHNLWLKISYNITDRAENILLLHIWMFKKPFHLNEIYPIGKKTRSGKIGELMRKYTRREIYTIQVDPRLIRRTEYVFCARAVCVLLMKHTILPTLCDVASRYHRCHNCQLSRSPLWY